MRFTVLASLALASVAASQSLADIPSCAATCLEDSIKQSTSCSFTDVACICGKFDVIQGTATGCIIKGCGSDTALSKVLPATKKLCSGVSGSSSSSGDSSAPKQPSPSGSVTVIPPPPPANTGVPSPVPTAGAATASSIGGLAMLALAALAL